MLKRIINFFLRIILPDNNFFYVGSADKLPEPLSKEEELDLVIKAEGGDVKARDKLVNII